MDDIEYGLKRYRDMRALKNQKRFKLIADTMGHDGRLIWELMSLAVAQRFNIDLDNVSYSPCHKIAYHFIENDDIEMGFKEWLYSDTAPFLKPLYAIGTYFPEFKGIARNDKEVVRLANRFYNLDLMIEDDWYTEYVYSFSLDFNSFIPINLDEMLELKREIDFCRKYGLETDELEKRLAGYGLTLEELEGV